MEIVLDDSSLAFDGVSFFAYTGVSIVGRGERCTINQYLIWSVVLVDGQRMRLNANFAIWSTCLWRHLVVCWFICRFELLVPTTIDTL